MDDNLSTIVSIDQEKHHPALKLDFRGLPPIYVLATHLSINEQHEAEDALSNGGASLTYDINEALIVLGNISQPRRAKSELQWKGLRVEDIENEPSVTSSSSPVAPKDESPAKKRRKRGNTSDEFPRPKVDVVIDDSSTASEKEDEATSNTGPISQLSLSQVSTSSDVSSSSSMTAKDTRPPLMLPEDFTDRVRVAKLDWLNDSLSAGKVLLLKPYVIYTGRLLKEPARVRSATIRLNETRLLSANQPTQNRRNDPRGIIERANADPKPSVNRYTKRDRIKDAANKDFAGKSFSSSTQAADRESSSQHVTRPTHLLHQTTSEHDEVDSSILPPMPDWVRENKIYACERATPLISPNEAFICQLKKIKKAREFLLDEIGIRAYSSSIASLAAYPYRIQSTREILALPSCDQKIAHLFHEYQMNDGKLEAVNDLEADPALKVIGEFYEIWGVGAKTAREFYYDKGWRDLDDVLEYGWKSLSRVQQIGLKYYDEFMLKIPRAEVESIAATITEHACRVTDKAIESCIVGGYRRGKAEW